MSEIGSASFFNWLLAQPSKEYCLCCTMLVCAGPCLFVLDHACFDQYDAFLLKNYKCYPWDAKFWHRLLKSREIHFTSHGSCRHFVLLFKGMCQLKS